MRNGFTSKLLLLQINEEFSVINFTRLTQYLDRGIEDKARKVNSSWVSSRTERLKNLLFEETFADIYLSEADNSFLCAGLNFKLHFYRDLAQAHDKEQLISASTPDKNFAAIDLILLVFLKRWANRLLDRT